jgi:hypothetical protein
MILNVERRTSHYFGTPAVRFVCPGGLLCAGFETLLYLVPSGEPDAEREMQRHLEEFHLAELADEGYGPCSVCRRVTDWLRADNPKMGPTWLCERHAPASSLREVLGSQSVSIEIKGG